MSADSFAARAEAGRRNVVAHRSIGISGRHAIVRQLDAECLLGAAGSLKNRTAVRTKSARTVADHGLREFQTLFIGNTPSGVFFFDRLLKSTQDLGFDAKQFVVRNAADIHVHFTMCGNRVHRRTALDRTDREGGLGIFRNLDVRDDIAGAADSVDGARNLAEVGKGVAACAVHG